MLITFSGLDGAGKSTLIDWLQATLQQRNERVAVFHMHHDVGVYACVRFVRDRLLGRPANGRGQPAQRVPRLRAAYRSVRHRIVWSKMLRRFIYPADLFVFLLYRLYFETLQRRVLIMDRYFYDTLVDVSDGRHWFWIRLLERITPTPEVPVFLDIQPEESYSRKGEYSVPYLRARWIAYKTVFPWVRAAVTLPNRDLSAAQAALRTVVMERLGDNGEAAERAR